MKLMFFSIYYNLLLFIRVKQAVFFTVVFPVFLFILFNSIWGTNNPLYVNFSLTGVLGMTLMNEGFFTIGPTLRDYKTSNFVQFLQRQPKSIMPFFSGLIISRVLILIIVTGVLVVTGLYFGAIFTPQILLRLFGFVILGMLIFSFIGLILAFYSLNNSVGKNLTNFIQVIILFISDTFYPASQMNSIIGGIGNIFPLNPLLKYARSGVFEISMVFWLIIPPLLFFTLFKHLKHDR